MLDATAPPFDPADLEPSLRPFGQSRMLPAGRLRLAAGVRLRAGTVLRRVLDLRGPRGRPGGDGRPAGGQGRRGPGCCWPGGPTGRCGRSPTPAGTAATSCSASARQTTRRTVLCPYHAWTYDLDGTLRVAPGFREHTDFRAGRARPGRAAAGELARVPVRQRRPATPRRSPSTSGPWTTWSPPTGRSGWSRWSATPTTWPATGRSSSRTTTSATTARSSTPSCARSARRPAATTSSCDGAWVGGTMDLKDHAATMSLDGHSDGVPIPGLDGERLRTVAYLGLFPNLLLSLPPRLRDDPPGGAAGRGPQPRRLHLVLPARGGRAARLRPRRTRSTSGTGPTARTGRPASRCSGA